MTSTVASPSDLRPDEKPLAEYRAVSRAAVAAVLLGLASAVILLTPLLAPLPIGTAIIALLALRAIGNSGGQLVGKIPATAGLCLAVLFLGWGISRHFSRQAALEASARKVAESWLNLMQKNQLEQAHQFRQPPENRLSDAGALKEYYAKNAEAKKDLQSFATQEGVRELIINGPETALRFDGVMAASHDGFTDSLQLKYTLLRSPQRGGELPMWIYVSRHIGDKSRRSYWLASSLDTTPPAGAQ